MTSVEHLMGLNPYPGLRAFAQDEAELFFGRRQQIEELVNRLREVSFLAVAGSSGCGKSSLVIAGLLNELKSRPKIPGEKEWRPVVLRPGGQPIANLAKKLAPVIGGNSNGDEECCKGFLYGRLQLGGLGLVEAVKLARLDPRTQILVVIDQFEEIFRFKRMTDPDEASAFVKLLLNAAHAPDSPVSIVITIRSDSLGHCAEFRDLPETLNEGQYLVPKLTRNQRKEAIEKPAELRGFKVAPRLVQCLLNDVSDDFDELPILQHALTRTWNKWTLSCQGNRDIDFPDYLAAGTARDAISNHADEALRSLTAIDPRFESVAEKTFQALTERTADGTEIRRPLGFRKLCEVVGGDSDDVAMVIDRFRRVDTAFLMPPPNVAFSDDPVIDISHESLMRQWDKLKNWIQAEADSRAILMRLIDAAKMREKGDGGLWTNPALATTLRWKKKVCPTDAWVSLYIGADGAAAWETAQRFLTESTEEVQRSADKLEREQRQRRRVKKALRVSALAVTALSILAAIVFFTLLKQAKSRELASKALLSINHDPSRTAHLAMAALDQDSKNPAAVYALRQALSALETAHTEKILLHDAPVLVARFSPDGKQIITASGNLVTIFDRKTYTTKTFQRKDLVIGAWLISNGKTLLTETVDGQAQLQQMDGMPIRELICDGKNDKVFRVVASPNGQYVAAGCRRGRVLVWDTHEQADRPKYGFEHSSDATITALAFAPDSQYVASGDANGGVQVWKLGHRGPWLSSPGLPPKRDRISHSFAIRYINFLPESGNFLVTAADDNTAIVWALDLKNRRLEQDASGGPRNWKLAHQRPVVRADFAPRSDGTLPVITISDKTASIWINENKQQIRGHDDWVLDANTSNDGELLVTASADGTARLWSTRTGGSVAVLRGHRDSVTQASFSPDGRFVITASSDKTVRIWSINLPYVVQSSDHWILSAAFDPSGERLATTGEDGKIHLSQREPTDGAEGSKLDVPLKSPPKGAYEAGVTLSMLSWSRNGRQIIATRYAPGIVRKEALMIWDVKSNKEIEPNEVPDAVRGAFSRGMDLLVTVGFNSPVVIWDVGNPGNLKPRTQLGTPAKRWLAAISPDGKWVATVGDDGFLLWDLSNQKNKPVELLGHKGEVTSIDFSPNSELLISSSRDLTARIWPVRNPGRSKVLAGGHTAALAWASFRPDGKQVVTASADGTIRVWNVDTAEELGTLRWHGEGVNQAQFSGDGTLILSASDDGTVKLGRCDVCNWDLSELRSRAYEYTRLLPEDIEDLKRETSVKMRWLSVPALFWGSR